MGSQPRQAEVPQLVVLNREEEDFLRILVDAYERGESVEDFIENRLNGELRHLLEGPHSSGGVFFAFCTYSYEPEYEVERSLCESLVRKGMLSRKGGSWFGNLTPDGRNYFRERGRLLAERLRERDEERAYSRRQATRAFAASAGLSLLLNYDKVALAAHQLASWLSSLAPGT